MLLESDEQLPDVGHLAQLRDGIGDGLELEID